MKTTRRNVILSGAAVSAAMVVPRMAAFAAAPEVKLGVVGVLSGPAAQWGLALRGAVEFVAAEANRDGLIKIGGQTANVSVVAIDSKYTAEGAAAAANSLAGQGIKVILGPIGSPELTGIKPIAMRNSMLVMGNGYAKDAIGPQWPLVFHQGPGPSGWADPIIKIAKNKFGMKSVVVVAPNDQGGTDIASVDAQAYKANGIAATEEYYQRGTTNFAPIVTRIMNQKPEAVDLASSPPGDAGIIVKQLRQAGFEGAIGRLGGPGYSEISRVAGGDEVLKDFYWYEPVFIDEKVLKIADDYKTLMKAERPENNLFFQWVSVARMVTKAIAKAGTANDTQQIAAALRSLPVDDPNLGAGGWIGQKFFGINQELSFPFGVGLVVKGKLQPVQRVDAATET
ncbi:ABC transporter substrate-binding protein [Chelatococcus asaccharovorans]|uniref:ABC transporter substrate-binding protein n=1 Tax=Chelatococcus asaccharovorans TaxID=28210 RepID=UPI00224C791C|nr:ABC transporter substrate-binding protein [Chelatococcus asaccharovorans]CAH1663391.1 Amino acid/amide ABC transporter substrate-binding protein (HAAT family) [Chelatococcus asaccharovorans]CAH1682815.1 Amino acid/amide ABC transporter substrate-binding protein (HAAT family) [Chelatococcus asaccharovorans]